MDVLVRYGEIFLKGNNRSYFENMLIQNIKKQIPETAVRKLHTRLIVTLPEKNLHLLKKVFGIVSYSPTYLCTFNYHSVHSQLEKLRSTLPAHARFRVRCARLQKQWESSKEIEKKVGSFVVENFGWTVDLEGYEQNIGIEVIDACYLYIKTFSGYGGLPVGVSGDVVVDLNTERDTVAALLAMKRGCRVRITEESNFTPLLMQYSPFPIAAVAKETSNRDAFRNEHSLLRARISSYSLQNCIEISRTVQNQKKDSTSLKTAKDLALFAPLVGMTDDTVAYLFEKYCEHTSNAENRV